MLPWPSCSAISRACCASAASSPDLEDAVRGIGAGLVEPDEYIPRLDRVAVAHQDLLDDPSLQMLDFLAAGIHLDQPRGNDRA